MTKPRITVVGSFAVGLTIRAPNIPVFGVTMLGSSFDMGPGGKGSNQAVATARLGAESSLVAIIGKDKFADIATDLYKSEGVDAAYVKQIDESPTAVGFIILNDRGENFIIMDYGATNAMDPAFVDRAEIRIRESDVVMAVLEPPVDVAMRAMELGRKHGKKTILNPAPAAPLPDEIFKFIDYLTPNESELRILLGLRPDDPRPSRELVELLRKRGASNVIVTLGDRGVLIVTDTIDTAIPAAEVEVVDTTGAGDAFNSGFAVALAEGQDVIEAARFGICCGALVCSKLGVIPGMATRRAAEDMYRTIFARR
ncbi:ribokinase [Bradyrhizobium sp. CCBAU 53380]|uniref:ribokinase n=1 Tax=Bradyrhizobium sp. CCBAU 53380 TaxID=1325117 RepID=UPI002303F02C|nr:ribokinase [Bradyrhizobium sp. CCBAU 53380]MDA9421055.1 ribokinase [Bradyrhizobium sp. CCBAU 53380]